MSKDQLKDGDGVLLPIAKNEYVLITKLNVVDDTDELDVDYKYVGKLPDDEVERLVTLAISDVLENALENIKWLIT